MTAHLEIQNNDKKRTLISVDPGECEISEYNIRRTREQEDIEKLAQRIKRIGFEKTRAPFAYGENDKYQIFAGGTRLEAIRRCSPEVQEEFYVWLHEGYVTEDYVRLSQEDNESDEYHIPVPFTDLWQFYSELYNDGNGWSQKKIAQQCLSDMKLSSAKSIVSRRINAFYELSEGEKELCQHNLTENHVFELLNLRVDTTFSDWLITEQARHELLEKAIKDKRKNGKKTVKALRKDVNSYRRIIDEAKKQFDSLPDSDHWFKITEDGADDVVQDYSPREKLIAELSDENARTLLAVRACGTRIRREGRENKKMYKKWLEVKEEKEKEQAIRDAKEESLMECFANGDACDLIPELEDELAKLLLVDPPYGQNYQSNRRWASPAPDKIKNDTKEEAFALLDNVLKKAKPKLTEDAHVLVFCNWKNEPEFRRVLELSGFNLKGSLIWVKEEHSAGDVKGAFAPSHERILHAVQGSPMVSPRVRDVLEFGRASRRDHPHEKPVQLLKTLIKSTTEKEDFVIDPLAGLASTLVAANSLERRFWGCEIEKKYWNTGMERLLKLRGGD